MIKEDATGITQEMPYLIVDLFKGMVQSEINKIERMSTFLTTCLIHLSNLMAFCVSFINL